MLKIKNTTRAEKLLNNLDPNQFKGKVLFPKKLEESKRFLQDLEDRGILKLPPKN